MTNQEKNFISAVVYVHNDEREIGAFLQRLIETLEINFEKYEIVCVNDASSDHSDQVVRETAQARAKGIVSMINMSFHQGLEPSMNAGLELAIGDFVYEFDSIATNYDPGLIMDVYWKSLEGFDIVAASSEKRRLVSAAFYSVFNQQAHLKYNLQTESFRILSRRAIHRILSMSKTIPYRKALYANCGLKMETLLFSPKKIGGKKKLDTQYRFDTAFDALILFTNLAYKIAILFAAAMMIATLVGGIYTIVIYALGIPVAGYTTTMLVITTAFFGVFGFLAIVIKYLSVIVRLVFSEQRFNIESIEKISKRDRDLD